MTARVKVFRASSRSASVCSPYRCLTVSMPHCIAAIPWTRQTCQELLSHLPDDTCPIPEPPDIPAIPEAEDRIDDFEAIPAYASANTSETSPIRYMRPNRSEMDQTRIHPGRDRWVPSIRNELECCVHLLSKRCEGVRRCLVSSQRARRYSYVGR